MMKKTIDKDEKESNSNSNSPNENDIEKNNSNSNNNSKSENVEKEGEKTSEQTSGEKVVSSPNLESPSNTNSQNKIDKGGGEENEEQQKIKQNEKNNQVPPEKINQDVDREKQEKEEAQENEDQKQNFSEEANTKIDDSKEIPQEKDEQSQQKENAIQTETNVKNPNQNTESVPKTEGENDKKEQKIDSNDNNEQKKEPEDEKKEEEKINQNENQKKKEKEEELDEVEKEKKKNSEDKISQEDSDTDDGIEEVEVIVEDKDDGAECPNEDRVIELQPKNQVKDIINGLIKFLPREVITTRPNHIFEQVCLPHEEMQEPIHNAMEQAPPDRELPDESSSLIDPRDLEDLLDSSDEFDEKEDDEEEKRKIRELEEKKIKEDEESFPSLTQFRNGITEKLKNKTSPPTNLPAKETDEQTKIENIEIPLKNRFNFASFDAGANVLEKPQSAQDARSILLFDKNKYMLMRCDSHKYFTIQLAEDIMVDTVAIANFEFYSSNFQNVTIYGSQKYPNPKWVQISSYTASDERKEHTIRVSRTWVRYIRINITSHYGNEWYCTISSVRVFGDGMLGHFQDEFSTMVKQMNDLENVIAQERGDNSSEDEINMMTPVRDFEWYIKETCMTSMEEEPSAVPVFSEVEDESEEASLESVFTTLTKRIAKLETDLTISSDFADTVLYNKLKNFRDTTDVKFKKMESQLKEYEEAAKNSRFTKPTILSHEPKKMDEHEFDVLKRIEVLLKQNNSTKSTAELMVDEKIDGLEIKIQTLEANLNYALVISCTICLLFFIMSIYKFFRCCFCSSRPPSTQPVKIDNHINIPKELLYRPPPPTHSTSIHPQNMPTITGYPVYSHLQTPLSGPIRPEHFRQQPPGSPNPRSVPLPPPPRVPFDPTQMQYSPNYTPVKQPTLSNLHRQPPNLNTNIESPRPNEQVPATNNLSSRDASRANSTKTQSTYYSQMHIPYSYRNPDHTHSNVNYHSNFDASNNPRHPPTSIDNISIPSRDVSPSPVNNTPSRPMSPSEKPSTDPQSDEGEENFVSEKGYCGRESIEEIFDDFHLTI